jgi:hypothetical protein
MRHAAERFPHLPSEVRQELVQHALDFALGSVTELGDSTLADLAKAAMPNLVGKLHRHSGRSGARLKRQIAPDGTLEPVRRARPPRMPHQSKGTVPMIYPGGEVLMIPVEVGDPLGDRERIMLHRIQSEIVSPRLRDELVSPEQRRALDAAYGELFGAPPEQAWAQLLVEEIRQAKLDKLGQEMGVAVRAARTNTDPPANDGTSATLALTVKGRDAYPQIPTNQVLNVHPTVERISGDSATFTIGGDLNGEPRTVGRMVGRLGPRTNGPCVSYEAGARANEVLLRAIERLAGWPGSSTLPDYVLDQQLIQMLIERMGFEGGGGPHRVLSAQRVFEFLVDPAALADEVESYCATTADRLDESSAQKMETGFRGIAARIRSCIEASLRPAWKR